MTDIMKAVMIRGYGSNEVVQIEEVERPRPGPDEVLLRVQAAGVNPIDWKIRDGAGERLGMVLPIRLGGELVGTVEGLGDGVGSHAVGDTVFGMVHTGAFAEWAVAKAADTVTVPSNLNVAQAAALPLAGTTAWQAMFGKADLSADQRIFITNGSGGVGSLAVQFAKARGAHVTAMASGRNRDFVLELGADAFVDYTAGPFEDAVRDMDVVFDTVGGDTFERGFGTLRRGGAMVTVVAFPKDEGKRFGVSATRSFTTPSGADLAAIVALVEDGSVRPHVQEILPLAEVRQALALSQEGRSRGKIVLAM